VSSAQQIVGMQTPSFMPTGFGRNPAMADNITGMMQQQPAAPSPFAQFGQQPQQGGFAGFAQQPANPQLANQLSSSMQSQIGGIPQQNNPLPPQGTFNFNTVMQQPAPSAVAVNPAFGGVPSTPAAPFQNQQQNGQAQFGGQQVAFGAPQGGFAGFAQQQAPIGFAQFGQTPVNIQPQASQVQGFQEDPEEGNSSDDESSDEGEGPIPIPSTDPAQVASAMAAAGLAVQPATFSFGQPQQAATPPAAVANPLAAAQPPNPLQVAFASQTQAAAPVATPNPLLAAVEAAQPPK
jgi:hypothetical protein